MTNPDSPCRSRNTQRSLLGAAGLGVVVVAAILPACSTKSGQPATQPTSTASSPSATIMVDGHKHAFPGGVECTSSPAQPSATPAESGNQTTRIKASDDSASVSMSLSDGTPPAVNGFAISLKVGPGQYQMPYQSVQSPSQVEATKDGKSYTVEGTGQGLAPGQSTMRDLTFGIHVTCP
jgi:Mycobacterium 19 kDa lipoprotein antigen